MSAKYSDKIKELELVGQYVDRLGMIESNLSQDVDEGKIDRYVLSLLEYCIDRINRVYIEGEKRYNSGDDCCEHSDNYDYVTAMNKDEEFIKENYDVDNLLSDVTQSDECDEKESI